MGGLKLVEGDESDENKEKMERKMKKLSDTLNCGVVRNGNYFGFYMSIPEAGFQIDVLNTTHES